MTNEQPIMLAMDLGDVAAAIVVILMVIFGLAGQIFEKQKKTGPKTRRDRPEVPPLRPQTPPPDVTAPSAPRPARLAAPSGSEEDMIEIRLPSGKLVARVRRPTLTPEPTQPTLRPKPRPRPRPEAPKPVARPAALPEEPARPFQTLKPGVRPTTALESGLGASTATRSFGMEDLVHIAKPSTVGTIPLRRAARARHKRAFSPQRLREAVILSEIYRPPLSLRDEPHFPFS